jgi:hypothetical protein
LRLLAKLRGPILISLALASFAEGARASVRLFSYDPADDVTRKVAGRLTFEFEQRLIFVKVLKILSTEGEASAALKPADEGALGHGGLGRLIGDQGHERDLYEVTANAEGADLIRAFCPGSTRGWLAFGRIAEGRELHVRALGDTPGGGPARLCRSFDFNYHGEWKVPGGQPVKDRDLPTPKFPY